VPRYTDSRITISMSPIQREKLGLLAENEETTIGPLIRRAIRDCLERHEDLIKQLSDKDTV